MDKDTIVQLAREAGGLQDGLYFDIDVHSLERFAALVAAHEREQIMDEWWSCVQSDLEHGVKWLNEQAAEKWCKEYPQISNFAAAIRSRT